MSCNQLTTVPKSITKPSNLTRLDLRYNQLTTVPDTITKLSKLTELILSYNPLKTIPKSITSLSNLTRLGLGSNQLTAVPDSITKLSNLVELSLSGNQLKTVPEYIANLPKLTGINLSHNQLKSIPESITNLPRLTGLILSYNQLKNIPESIIKLSNLTELILSHNQLKSIPESITNLPNLIGLDLSNNLLENPPLEIANQGIKAIREYFRQLKEEGEDYLYEAKLLIVGEAGSGKTTLAKKIKNPNYKLQLKKESTEGIDVIKWSFDLENERNFDVNIWDFGGQEVYHATHQFFLTKRSLYALVVDNRKEDDNLEYWLNVVELLSNNSPLIIVKNEKQDRVRQIPQKALRGQFENLKETLATNLENNRDLDKIWSDEKYAAMQGRLLELMTKFQLCYKIPQSQDTFIAPQLLSVEPPNYNWDDTNNLILRYKYPDFMPKGIITRFIVVMHQWIDENPEKRQYVWRSGVVLNKDETKVEVIEYYGKREIVIRVIGNFKRDLMTQVTYELDKINDSFHRLNYQKLIPCNCDTCMNTQNPHSYDYQQLLERISSQKYTIECNKKPFHEVQILSLIDNAIDIKQLILKDQEDFINQTTIEGDIQQLIVQLVKSGNIKSDLSQNKQKITQKQGNYNENIGRDYNEQTGDKNQISTGNQSSVTPEHKNKPSQKKFDRNFIITIVSTLIAILAIFFNGLYTPEIKKFLDSIFSKPTPELQQESE